MSFSFWLISLRWRSLLAFTLWQMSLFHSFYGWAVFCCIHMPRLIYPSLCHWTFRLFPCFGNCEQCCCEHGGAFIFFFFFFFFVLFFFFFSKILFKKKSHAPHPEPSSLPTSPYHQGLNLSLLHCRQILYHLSHQGSPFWQDIKIITAERKIFSTKGLVKWNIHMTKMNVTFTPGIKIHARWNIDLNFRAKIIKLLEENKKKIWAWIR